MNTPTFARKRLDTPGGRGEMTGISSLSFTPNSPQTATTPRTPQYTLNVFGTGVAVTPTPLGSNTKLPPFTGFSVRQVGGTTTTNDFATNGMDQQFHPNDTANHIGNYAHAMPLSQMWAPVTPRPTPPERASHIGRETPVHMRWGSLDAQPSRSGVLSSAHSLTQHSPFVPGHRPTLTADEVTVRNYRDQMTAHHLVQYPQASLGLYSHLPQEGRDHVHGNRTANPIDTDSDAFGLEDQIHNLLQTPEASDYGDNIQDLGIDVLRISPKEYPVRQPMPAPSSIKVLPNNNHHVQGFLPMQAVMQQTPRGGVAFSPETVSPGSSKPTPSSKFSSRYHGMHTESNASAEHIPTELNCALWLTNLPPNVTTKQLLAAIRNVGRIWCSYINYPDYLAHQTAAAKVVFFSPEAAQGLLSMSWTKGLYIEGYRVKVSHNRIKYSGHPVVGKMSRSLIITGRSDIVNEDSLTRFFKDRFIFQVDEVVELIKAGGRAVVEYKFGSYRCQSQMGKMSLEKDRPAGFEKVEFGDDPCEVGDTMASYGVAAERIQGRGL